MRPRHPVAPPPPAPPAAAKREWCPYAGAMLPQVDRVLNAMAAMRPTGARLPHEFGGYRADEVEAEQMAAFEAGAERWWLVVPPAPGAEPDEWTYCDEAPDPYALPGAAGAW